MHTITGKEFKNLIRGAGLKTETVQVKAGVAPGTLTRFFRTDGINKTNYDKLVKAFDDLTSGPEHWQTKED